MDAGGGGQVSRPSVRGIALVGLADVLATCYRMVGGVLAQPPERPGPWDLQLDDLAVELDEERHFNRYRAVTLDIIPYQRNGDFLVGAYQSYCAARETECLQAARWGGYWTNRSAESQFGPADPPGILGNRGAPRWRQRAYYDALKDLASIGKLIRLSRVAIWDQVEFAGRPTELADLLDRWPRVRSQDRPQLRNSVKSHVRRSLVSSG